MPNVKPYEKEQEFISRCIGVLVGEGKDTDQAAAICHSKWDEHKLSGGTSFDYDGVLSTDKGKELAKRTGGAKYIISARNDKAGMRSTAVEVGIPLSNVYATGSNKAKIEKIKELGITKHYDNNQDVIKELGSKGELFNG